MWYKKEDCQEKLDYSRAIICEHKVVGPLLLIPVLENMYEVIGYDWFSIRTGKFNSCIRHKTPEEAVRSYRHHKIFNVDIQY